MCLLCPVCLLISDTCAFLGLSFTLSLLRFLSLSLSLSRARCSFLTSWLSESTHAFFKASSERLLQNVHNAPVSEQCKGCTVLRKMTCGEFMSWCHSRWRSTTPLISAYVLNCAFLNDFTLPRFYWFFCCSLCFLMWNSLNLQDCSCKKFNSICWIWMFLKI